MADEQYLLYLLSDKDQTEDLRHASGLSVDPFTGYRSRIRSGRDGRVTVKKAFLRGKNKTIGLRYATEPRPQHY